MKCTPKTNFCLVLAIFESRSPEIFTTKNTLHVAVIYKLDVFFFFSSFTSHTTHKHTDTDTCTQKYHHYQQWSLPSQATDVVVSLASCQNNENDVPAILSRFYACLHLRAVQSNARLYCHLTKNPRGQHPIDDGINLHLQCYSRSSIPARTSSCWFLHLFSMRCQLRSVGWKICGRPYLFVFGFFLIYIYFICHHRAALKRSKRRNVWMLCIVTTCLNMCACICLWYSFMKILRDAEN